MPWTLLAALIFADPAGDAHGNGGYLLPQRPQVAADALDLRSFEVQPQGKGSQLTIGFGGHQNPWDLASGFSAGVTDIFVKTGPGGEHTLPGLRLNLPPTEGWQYHLHISGAGATLKQVQGEGLVTLPAPEVRLEGTNLIVDAPALPAGRFAYWVTSSVYSPLAPDGRLQPGAQINASGVQAPSDRSPVPVDVLAAPEDHHAYTGGVLYPVGQTHDWRLTTLTVLGVLGLLTTVGATVLRRRRRP